MYEIILDIIGTIPGSVNISTSTIINIIGALIILFSVVVLDWLTSIFIKR